MDGTQTPASPTPTSPTTDLGTSLLNDGGQTEPPKPAEGEPKPEATKAPEAYSDYKVPDGYTLDPAVKTKADALFKAANLTQDQAQGLVDLYTELTSDVFKQPFQAWDDMVKGWKEQALAHPDLAGKIGPGKEVSTRIAKMYDTLNNPELVSDFKQFMDLTGAGSNVAFIRVLDKLAQKVTEGTPTAPGLGPSRHGQSADGNARPPSTAAAIWPKLPTANR